RSGPLASDVATVRLKWGAGAAAPACDDALKPKLYGLIVGVSSYQDTSVKLKFAAKDARDFAAALATPKCGLYRDVELKVLVAGGATSPADTRPLTVPGPPA